MGGPLLGEIVSVDDVRLPLEGASDGEVLAEFADLCVRRGFVNDRGRLLDLLREREALGTTAIGAAIAIPHARLDDLDGVRVVIGVSPTGVLFGGRDGPTRLFFVVLSSSRSPSMHIRVLAHVSRVARAPGLVDRLVEATEPKALLALLDTFERGVTS